MAYVHSFRGRLCTVHTPADIKQTDRHTQTDKQLAYNFSLFQQFNNEIFPVEDGT